jgi:hypothetical protein
MHIRKIVDRRVDMKNIADKVQRGLIEREKVRRKRKHEWRG